MSLSIIFTIGSVIFTGSSLFFWFTNNKKPLNSSLLVAAVTTISYLVMLEGSLASQHSNGAIIHWTRWVGYSISCPLLFYTVASGLESAKRKFTLSSLMALVMISGAFSAVWSGWIFWSGFIFSTFLFVIALISLFKNSDKETLRPMRKYIWFGWTIFPVVFLFAPSGLYILSASFSAAVYLLLDIFTKIIFYVEINPIQN